MTDYGDFRVESYPERQHPGGQHVGLTSTGIKVTHIASGVFAVCEAHRSQHKNHAVAMDMVLAALTHPKYAVAA